ncbi:MAG: tetraacyldisaccharide 4'-kinase [candidate division Zixibacteria bacterium]|nr:tetraacyldisaccharide 4'-kinase [candidate division Zixibacteria bacterium]
MKRNKYLSFWDSNDKSGVFLLLLRFLTFLYYSGYILRKLFYRSGLLKIKELKVKVISVGNITLGGSGKTPFVLYLARKLKDKRMNFAILTRGYKRRSKGTKELKRSESPDLKWEEVGDEPFLLSDHLPEDPIIIGKNRYNSGKIAQDKYKAEVLILDDGFQHWRLKRDLDIVMVDASSDLEKEKLFPEGRLREPLSSLKRANLFILTRVDQSPFRDKLKDVLKKNNLQAPVVESILGVTSIINWRDKTEISLNQLKGKKVIAFCGIGNPFSFEKTLKSLGVEILNAFFFLDHYIYSQNDFFSLEDERKKAGAGFLITTEKDSIRLPEIKSQNIPLLVVQVELKIISGEEKLWEILNI